MRKNSLPNIKIDSVLGQFPNLKEGTEVNTTEVIKGLWAYIREHNLKIKKV